MRKLFRSLILTMTVCVVGQLVSPVGSAFAYESEESLAEAPHGESEPHGEGESDEGVPLAAKTDLAVWSLVVFIAFILVLRKFAWGPLTEGLDKREAGIRQDIADAEAARVKAEQMLAEHQQKLDAVQDEVKEILAEARRDAEQTGQRIVSEAQGQTETMKNRALAEIERSKDQALKELFDAMAGQVATATEYVLGHGLNADDQDQLIQEAIAQLGNGAET